MGQAVNRVLLAFKSWEDRKKEIEPVLKAGATDAQTLLRLQLDHLQRAYHRLRQTVRPDEKPFMILLDNQISKLERQLYPNLLYRIFARLKDRFYDGPAYLKQLFRQRNENMESLKLQLRNTGLGSFAGRLEHHLDAEQKQVRLPMDCQLGPEKRLTLDLQFNKDAYDNYQLSAISGTLLQNGKIVKSQEFELSNWPNLQTNQIWSLLEGRAMRQQYIDASGHENHRWVELGAKGAQHYEPDYSFDIKTALAAMPAITRNKEELTHYLENGQQIPTHWKQGGQYQSIYVQADPANRCIKLLDEKLRPVTAEKLNQACARQGLKVKMPDNPVQKMRKTVKNGIQH